MTTIRAFLEAQSRAFSEIAGTAERRPHEVWALGCHVLGRSLAQLLAVDSQEPLRPEDEARWRALIERRLQGEPTAYLLGFAEFWSMTLTVTPDVLVPRPETEVLVEHALEGRASPDGRYLDLGTGSGAIAFALKKECPGAVVVACDRSAAALALARANGAALGLDVLFFRGSWLEAVGPARFDMLVSNPPYIESADPCLLAEGLRYEPRTALEGGSDGLAALSTLIPQAIHALRPRGRLLVEHGAMQGAATRSLLAKAGFSAIRTHPDYAGHERVSEGMRDG